jgi:hypothetical protein
VSARIVIRGETWFTLETVARCYEIEVGFLEEVYEQGLLGRGERVGASLAVAAEMLDRVARILRLHRQGVDVAGIALLLREPGP